MDSLVQAMLDDDRGAVKALVSADPSLVTAQVSEATYYDEKIFHWLYVGDTALHLAAAGYRTDIVKLLLAAGADPNANANHRRSTPLHYAADGFISGPCWDPGDQVGTIRSLLDAGAKVDAQDKNGATALHRAVRTRCVAAVECLLSAGADPRLRNNPGSTPFHLAAQTTGRGGSGEKIAKEAQQQIIQIFLDAGVSPTLRDCKGKSVLDWARSERVRAMLVQQAK